MKRFIKAIAIILGLVSITACQPKAANPLKSYDYSQMKLIQFEPIEQGSPIAIIETDYGTIKIVLYPEEAPNTVENFIYLAEKGFMIINLFLVLIKRRILSQVLLMHHRRATVGN